MSYKFPSAEYVDDYLKAIEGRDEFVVKRDEVYGYGVINYVVNFEDTFPDPNQAPDEQTARNWALRRDCRGLKFDLQSGKIISKPYHKFFNLGERPETLPGAIDWSVPFREFEKLDGSMITPLMINGEVRWATKMGLTDVAKPVDVFTHDKPEYHEFCKYWMGLGFTPIFEWCSRTQRIVIDYPVDRLVLTAIRENISGEYKTYEEMRDECEAYGIPICHAGPEITGFDEEAVEAIRALEGKEGEVWRDKNGHMRKLKAEHYVLLHKTLEHLNHEKDVIRLIVDEKLDDAKPFLPEDLVNKADDFAKAIFTGLKARASDLYWEVQADYDNLNGSKKKFADKIKDTKDSRFRFWMWDNLEGGEEAMMQFLLQAVGNNLGSQTKVNEFRWVWGEASWSDFRKTTEE